MTEGRPRPEGLVVLALPRSGTTLLQRLLDAHPDLAGPPECYVLRGGARFLAEEPFSEGLRMGTLSGLAFAGFEEEEVIARTRAFCFGFLRDVASRAGKSVWVDKTPFNVFHAPEIERLCGDAVGYIGLLRHPADTVLSMRELVMRSHRFPEELHAYVRREPNLLHAYALAWVDGTRAILDMAARRPAQTFLLRYEDLVTDPQGELGRLCAHFGLNWDPSALSRALADERSVGLGDWKVLERREVDASSVGRSKKLSRQTLSELGALVNDVAVAAGYAPLKRVAALSPGEARRQLEVAHMFVAGRGRPSEP